MAAVGRPPRRAGDVAGFPDGDPFREGDPSGGGVDVGVEGLLDVDLLAADFGGRLGGVPGVRADGAVGEPEPHAVAGGASFYPGHGLLPSSETWSSRSGGCTLRIGPGGKSRSRTVVVGFRRLRRPTAGRAEAATIAARSAGEKRRCLPRKVHGTSRAAAFLRSHDSRTRSRWAASAG